MTIITDNYPNFTLKWLTLIEKRCRLIKLHLLYVIPIYFSKANQRKVIIYYILNKEKLLEKSPAPSGWCDQPRHRGGQGWGGKGWTCAVLVRRTLLSGGHALVTGPAVLVVFRKVACWCTNISVDDGGGANFAFVPSCRWSCRSCIRRRIYRHKESTLRCICRHILCSFCL